MKTSGPITYNEGTYHSSGEFSELVTISSGSDFAVYRALRDGKFWTLKTCLHPDTASTELLRREYDLTRNLRHPFISNAIGFESTPVGHAIVMEYVEGRTMAEYLKEGHTAADRKKVFGQILEAVQYLHRKSITHNDLKAENIIVSSVGDNIALIDFGLAESSAHHLTHHLGGTVGSSAPEVMDGDPSARTDAKTDIYSLGVLLEKMFGSHRYRHTVSTSKSADPAHRYASVEEFCAAMKRDERRPAILAGTLAVAATGIALATFFLAGQGPDVPVDSPQMETDVAADSLAEIRTVEAGSPEEIATVTEDSQKKIRTASSTIKKKNTDTPTKPSDEVISSRSNPEPIMEPVAEADPLDEIRTVLSGFAKESLDSLNNPSIAPYQEYGYNVLSRSTAKYLAYKSTIPASLHFSCDTISGRIITTPIMEILCRQTTLHDALQAGQISQEEYRFHLENAGSGGFFRPFAEQ